VVVALCFPGQGSQAAGMADGLLDSPAAVEMLDSAASAGLDLRGALGGDDAALRPTEIAQPALLFVECALLALLPDDLEVGGVAGHSVGEYAAAVAAGAFDHREAMRLVVERGRAMAAMREGTMSAVLGLEAATLSEICAAVHAETGEVVVVANHNAPGQVVISGSARGIEEASRRARDAGARRVLPLNVSGAFHSPLMRGAAARFAECLETAIVRDPSPPVVCNVDAEAVNNAEELRERLRRQLDSPVRWSDTVLRLQQLGCDSFVEVGPGTVLTGLLRRILPGAESRSVRNADEARTLRAAPA
jgi:[acyl-carrier-protein] S-malonyltransferase